MSQVPGGESRVDYIMMRMPRLDEVDDEEDLDENLNDDAEEGMQPMLAKALSAGFSRSTTGVIDSRNSLASNRRMSNALRMSVKVNLRSTESKLQLKNLSLIS